MSGFSADEIIRLVKEENIRFVRLQFTDIFGQLKNVTITPAQLKKALNNEVTIDGSSIEGFVRIHESDQVLHPDLNSFAVLPDDGIGYRAARLICDVYNPDGTPFVGDPRGILKRELKRAEELGYTFNVGPECEFFLFRTDENAAPTTKTADEAGYFDLAPLDHGEHTRDEICLALENMGFEIEACHHESAQGQHEIDFRYADALTAADNIMTVKLVIKSIAQKNGLHATFMPKPLYGAAGSGMHTNMSLFKDGRNIFCSESGERGLSRECYCFIAGLLHHVKGFCLLTNPLVNSYKRLVPGFEAPCYMSWSASNRSALIRIPSARGKGTRIELRSPDPTCNPYLAFAACLAAGLDGIVHQMTPPDEITENIFQMDARTREKKGIDNLPGTLKEAIDCFEQDALIRETVGGHVTSQYIQGKDREWDEYRTRVTNWEIERYLGKY